MDESHFEVCCIPFFVYNLALGDIVETSPSAGRKYMIRRVVRPSGRYVFRAWFGESSADRHEIAAALESLGALLEWSSRNLLALDARDASHATEIATFLQEHEDAGRLMYETGKTA